VKRLAIAGVEPLDSQLFYLLGIFTLWNQSVEPGTVVGLQEKLLRPLGIRDIPSGLADVVEGNENLIRQGLSQALPDIFSDAHLVCGDGDQWIPIVEHPMHGAFVVCLRV
jgi:hypothetical protein